MPPIGNTGGTGGSGATGGNAGAGGNAGQGGNSGAGGIGIRDACITPSDMMTLSALQPNARQVSATCGVVNCSAQLGQGEAVFTECATACMELQVPDLSTLCATCYGQLAWCAGLLCNGTCANNACSVPCESCTQGADYPECFAALAECTGRTSTDCE